jgi:protein TonB
MPVVPDTEGRVERLKDAVPENFQTSDQFAAPTAAPPLPSSQAPAPSVLGQAATAVSGSAPSSPNVLAPGEAAPSVRPVDERRTASTVVASLGGETGPVSPTEPVSFTNTSELGPIGSAPTEFREEITVPLNSEDPRFKEYLEAVKRRILEIWRYPDDAEPGLRGKVSIEFSIERDGTVSRVNVITTSGHIVLDRGATGAMHTASPFPPLPYEFRTNRLNVVGGFRYN